MTEQGAQPSGAEDAPPVPWTRLVRFVRQLSHDLRNHLNAAELQSVFINELAPTDELKDEIKRLRAMLATAGAALQKLSALVVPPRANPIPYSAAELVTDIQHKFEKDFADRKAQVTWQIVTTDASLEVDPQLMQEAVFELLDNAFRHGGKDARVGASARPDADRFVIEFREPKSEVPTAGEPPWAASALCCSATGHYGLGLQRVRAIATAHNGSLETRFDPAGSLLITTIMLPVSRRET